ncbi:hypothetical protein L2E82_17327 [Cichorium intybus]|uniref:Uncharacterized protein n=2 Tax=Cichorium intybus TaxID=13427 RepID=A0ACB9F8X4_CICIN|nr:hypothetical protein L2E82_17325 [Cichorium intybus]KAI3767238.1 hypothetical protein L2E82_17327 [Cichorium intybus]
MPMAFGGGGEERTEIKTKLAIMFAKFVLAIAWNMHYFLPDGSVAGSAKRDSVTFVTAVIFFLGFMMLMLSTFRDEATVAKAAMVINTACMSITFIIMLRDPFKAYFHDETKVSRTALVIENVSVGARLTIMFRAYFKAFLRKLLGEPRYD